MIDPTDALNLSRGLLMAEPAHTFTVQFAVHGPNPDPRQVEAMQMSDMAHLDRRVSQWVARHCADTPWLLMYGAWEVRAPIEGSAWQSTIYTRRCYLYLRP